MRHRIAHKHFNRDTNHRKALLKNLVRSLIEQGEITTTVEKAKEVRRVADKLISQAKEGSMAVRRTLHRFFGRRDAVNTLVDRVAPALNDRTSGFTRLSVSGKRRGDNATLATLTLVNKPATLGTLKSGQEFVKPAATTKKAEPKAEVKAKASKVASPAVKAAPAKATKPAAKKAAAKKTEKKS
ncbi:MAG TPA: 50S ribosomal protein L17 [Vitreimonas sp.]|nr:50S ribosomal protein L17 [Vitreimonas sp.]